MNIPKSITLAIQLELFFASSNSGSSTTNVVVSNVVCVPVTFKLPVIVVLALSSIPPEPLGSNVMSAFEGDMIVYPINEKSPTLTLANDNVPEPSVFKNCPSEPSDVG